MNLFLAPAEQDNVNETLKRRVKTEKALQYLRGKSREKLQQELQGADSFHCWAMTQGRKNLFDLMQPGDCVLIVVNGTGLIEYSGHILTKIHNRPLGENLWPVTKQDPWEYIYIFADLSKVKISKSQVKSNLFYSSDYDIPGVIKVEQDRVESVNSKYGSIDDWVAYLNSNPMSQGLKRS